MNKYFFKDIVLNKNGFLRGPFGGDLKKEIFVPKSKNTYKVYEQSVVLQSNPEIGKYYISEEYFNNKMRRFEVLPGDFVVSCSGVNYGAIYQLKENIEKGIINQALLRIRLNLEIIDSNYFFYLFKHHIVNMIIGKKGDSTIPNFPPISVIKELEIELPAISEQVVIGKLLKEIDSKIELNNKINTELEGMAKLIYEYWFVQFDFPFDFAQGKPADESSDPKDVKPYKSSGGKMVWNKELKREIPEGWEVKELKDIASITMGQSPPGESYNENSEGTVFYQGCTDFGNRFPTIRKFTTMPTRFANEGDLLLSVRAPVGTINISKEHCCIGRGLAALAAKNGQKTFLFGVMQNLKQIFDRRNVDGTTFGAITKDDLFTIKVVRPEKSILDHFHKLTITSFNKQNKCELENIQLSSLRDWLLPMLMNGQVRVREAESELNLAAEAPRKAYEKG
ncbi:restriction endonuclease subunit S [Algoriphagus sp. NF]|nr:restriction endonuclease subunit S [Algoriphagus sp. NF]